MSEFRKVPEIELQSEDDFQKIEGLLDLTFGKDRSNKAAYALRQDVEPIVSLSFVMRDGQDVIATLRFWPIKIGEYSALLLGPIAIKPDLQGEGLGIFLMKHGLKKAKDEGHSRVILVGDEGYYKRVGFSRNLALDLTMPGQADEERLLAKALEEGSFDGVKGLISKDYASKNCL